MTPSARAFLAAGTPGLARLLALVSFLLIGFALPQQAAAQVTPLITITTPENVCEGGTAVFPIALNVAQNEDIEIRHFVASATTHFVAGTSTTFTIPEGETSVEARLVTRVNPASTDNIVTFLGISTTNNIARTPAQVNVRIVDQSRAACASQPPTTTTAPDLTVDGVTVSSASVVEGASFTINATVNNEGNAASAATTLTYYRSANATISTEDTSIATDPIGTLAASGSSTQNASVSIADAETYYVGACVATVSGESNATNNCSTGVQVTVTEPATVAPAITTQPTDQSVTVGENATFTVTATGTPAPTYQWRFDGTEIAGATSASYTLSNAALTNAGDYTVVVTNTAGTVTSTAATLTVTAATVAPQITTQPTNQSVTVGETATFTVTATGTPAPTYQWRFDGTEISGATSASYTISSAALTNAGDYTVVVTNTAGTVTSTAATLTVTPAAVAPQITTQPTDQSVTVGENATFTVTATGTPAPTYQWHFDGTEISGATSASYAISSAALTNAGDYTVVVTNTAGEVTSSAATLTVTAATVAPQITTQPTDQSVTVGENATFTVAATGTPAPTYQWHFDGTEISGATSASYTISSAALTNAGDYTVVVTNTAGTVTSTAATLTVTPAAVAPQITTQPTDQSVTVGENATFTVAATGTPAPTYQWHFDGTEISGATSASYTISSAALTNAGDYTVVVTNTAGTVTSSAATLTVTAATVAPQITTQPTNQSVTVGETATFTVTATGTPTPTYQWSFDGTEISGATSASYTISSAALTNAGDYTVVVTNTAGEVTSTAATLTVTPAAVAPQITTQPTDQSVTVGENATFTVTATGTPAPTYQWHFDGTEISGATSASYTISSAALTNAGDYTVVVTNTAGEVTSSAATLTVTPAAVAPQITTQPTDQSVTVGENATFTVAATGTPAPTYQWHFDGTEISGATSASYTISSAALTNAGDYTVVVTNTAGTVTSTAATLTVTAAAVAPQITTQPTDQSVTVGENATFTVAATGTPTPSYQWSFDGTEISGATSASYTISSAALTNAGDYTVVVTNTAGTVTSTAATLTVTPAAVAPQITTQPTDQSVTVGENATFTVAATGTPTPSYQWSFDGTEISGATSASYTISSAALTNAGDYTVVVTNTAGTVTSSAATLTVTAAVNATVSIAAASAVENVSGGNAEFTVSLTTAVNEDVVLAVAYAVGVTNPVVLATDLGTRPNTVTIDQGQTSATLLVPIIDDSIVESDETFTVTISEGTTSLPTGVTIGTDDTATGTITNDDTAVLGFTGGTSIVPTEGQTFTFTVSFLSSGASSAAVPVTLSWAAMPSTSGRRDPGELADLNPSSGTVTIPAGQSSADISITAVDDTEDEPSTEELVIQLGLSATSPLPEDVSLVASSNPAYQRTVRVFDNDVTTASLSIGDISVDENVSGGMAEFTITLTVAQTDNINLDVVVTPGDTNPVVLADDLGDLPTTANIRANELSATIAVPIIDDELVEGDETFTVTIMQTTTSVPFTKNAATGTIIDNDDPPPVEATVSIGNASVAENDGNAEFTVSLTQAVESDVTVAVAYTDGTATLATDLGTRPTTVTIDEGNTEATLEVPIFNDNIVEGNEDFTVTISEGSTALPEGVTIGTTATGTGTITDNDLAEITLGPSTLEVAENGTFTYTVSLSAAADEAVTVRWTATDGTASVDDDLQEQTNTVTFDANDNTAQEFTISPVDDPDDEVNETFTVTLEVDTAGGNPLPTGVTIGTSNSSTATITDNDDPTGPDLTVDDVTVSSASVVEGASFTINATVNNGGNAASAATTLTYYRSADATITTGDTSIGTDAVGALAASGSSTQDASVSIATADTYYVGACVPTVSGETDTDNNCSTGVQVTVTAAAVAPQITTQPTDQSVTVGETATFTVTATGTPTPTYQWSFDGTEIAGATSASYAISSAALTNAGDYTVVVTNTAGTVTSTAATLTVTAAAVAPQITTQPTNQSVTVGGSATFTVTATGTPTPTYQWRFEGSDIAGATSASYTLSSAALTNAGDYTVVVTNTAGTVTSTAATLTVTPVAVAPQITTQPTDQSVTVGGSATFTVTATGTPTPTYQWRFEGSDISGATSASYTLSNAALTNAGEYTVVVTNTAGTVTSTAATLTVTAAAVAPQITTQPVNQSVTVGGSATFTVTATGTPTPTYQWRFEGSNIAGATSASYTLSSAAVTNAGDYTVVVTNTAGTVTSSAATLTVTPVAVAPQITTQPTNQSITVGGSATFTVTATGTPTPTYQWRFDGTEISGATSASYAISSAALTNAGEYTVVVTNTAGTVTSTAATLTVTAAPSGPDLTVDNVSVSSASVVAGAAFTINATVNNGGNAASAATTLTYYRSTNATITTGDTSIGTDAVSALAASGSSPENISVSIATAGTYYVGACVPTVSGETNTTNNCSTGVQVTVTAVAPSGPDLTVDNVSVSNASVVAGAAFTINATVNNGGNAASAATTLTYYRSTNATITTSDTSIGTDAVSALAASGSSPETISVSIATAGTYYVGACVPTVSGETNTNNNCSTGVQVTVTAVVTATASIANASVAENDGDAEFTVSLTRAVNSAVTLAVAYTAGTATLATDLGTRPTTVTIDRNQTSATLLVPITNDNIVEGNEDFTVTISEGTTPLPDGVTIGTNNTATGTIEDNDRGRVSLSPPTLTAAENETFTYTVRLNAPADEAVNITWTATAEVNDTATVADDLQRTTGTVTFTAGSNTNRTFTIPVNDDDLDEENETFTVTISATNTLPARVIIPTAGSTSAATITDNDDTPVVTATVSIDDESVVENVSGGTVTFTAALTEAVSSPVVLAVDVTAGTATLGVDLGTDLPTTVTIDANATEATFTVPITDDNIVEGNETFTVTLTADPDTPLPEGVTIRDGTATGTIEDDDRATVSIDPAELTAAEGSPFNFNVRLSAPADEAVTVTWTAIAGTAAVTGPNSDLAAGQVITATAVFSAGSTTAVPVAIATLDDTRIEGTETFTVTLTGTLPIGVTFGTQTATATMTDDDRSILSLNPAPTRAGATFTFTVNLTNPLVDNLRVNWTATGAAGPGADPSQDEPLSGTVTIRAGETSATFPIDTTGLTPGLSLAVTLSDEGLPDGVTLDDDRNTSTVTIPPDAAVNATVSIADADPVKEDAGPARFTVSLSQTVGSDVVLDITYLAGTAGLEDLGSSRPGTVTIPANATTAILAVPITDDPAIEEAETFTVTLSEDPDNPLPPEVDIADGTATGTIAFTPEPSILIEPRRTGAGTALRRHVGRFDRMTSTVVRNRLDDRQTRHLSGSRDLGDGALAMGGGLGDTNWGVWMDGAWAGLGGRSSGRQADIYGGVDYRSSGGKWLIGALVGHELADLDIGQATYEAAYTHFGLYGGGRLSARLLVDGALTYGLATPEVAQGSVSASYEAHRITARGALTGDFGLDYGLEDGVVKFQPQLGLLYAREQLGAFTDSVGRMAAREQLELGRVSAGPRVTWAFDGGQLVDGGQLAGGARGQWDFRRLGDGIDERVSGAVDIGLTLDLAPGVSLGIQGDVDGLGITDEFRSFGGKIKLGFYF